MVWISRPTRYVGLILWLSFYYLAYRYILQVNSHITSMTYGDTPTILQAGKYLFFLLVVLFYWMWGRKQHPDLPLPNNNKWFATFYSFLAIFPLFLFFFNPQTYYLELGIFFVLLIPALKYRLDRISFRWLSGQFAIFVWVSILWEAMQILLYQLFGRLPALAWGTSASVRYGSIWDDPNGYAIFMSFLIPFVYFRYHQKPWLMAILEGVLLVFLVMTQSMTGMATLCVSLTVGVLFLMISKLPNKKTILGLLVLVPTLLLMVACYHFTRAVPTEVVESKTRSIEEHKLAYLVLLDYLVGEEKYVHQLTPPEPLSWQKAELFKQVNKWAQMPRHLFVLTESGYVNMLINSGWLYLLLYLAAGAGGLILLNQALLHNCSGAGFEVCYGAYFFVIGYFVAMVNLPCEKIFPLNILMVMSILIAHAARVKSAYGLPDDYAQGDAT